MGCGSGTVKIGNLRSFGCRKMLAEVIKEMINDKKSLINTLRNEYYKPENKECKQLIIKTLNRLHEELEILENRLKK